MVTSQRITDRYAVYNGDCMEVMPKLPSQSVHMSVYSPPFGGLFKYSSSPRDLSNCINYGQFMRQYAFVIEEIFRVTMPGRFSYVHCMDVPNSNTGRGDSYLDFPGDIIRLHEKIGFTQSSPRICIWKEPLAVRNRTMTKALAHRTIVEDSTNSAIAGADYVLVFRKRGQNAIPVEHPQGLMRYAGERQVPAELLRYRGWTGNQIENRYSHWIWRQYASSFWDDIRGNTGSRARGTLSFKEAREEEDEAHLHPLQLDVIERALVLGSNPGETVLTPFMGVCSEVYQCVRNRRLGIGIELKTSYYNQALKNLAIAEAEPDDSDQAAFPFDEDIAEDQDLDTEPDAEPERIPAIEAY